MGTNLAHALLRHGFDPVIVDDLSTGLRENLKSILCESHEISILDYDELRRRIKDCSHIFHLGARGSVPRSLKNPRATFEVNVTGTLNVLECARASGAKVIFASSSSVYGSNTILPKDEFMWTAPLTPYAASKLAGEGIVQSYAKSYGLNAVTFRFFNIFGPWQRPDHDYAAVIPKWIWNLIHGKSLQVYGDGSTTRDFTFIDSVVDTLILAMNENLSHPSPINLAFGKAISLHEVITGLREHFGNFEVEYLPSREGDVPHSQNNPKLLNSIFPDVIPVDFHRGLQQTVEWFYKFGENIANGPRVLD